MRYKDRCRGSLCRGERRAGRTVTRIGWLRAQHGEGVHKEGSLALSLHAAGQAVGDEAAMCLRAGTSTGSSPEGWSEDEQDGIPAPSCPPCFTHSPQSPWTSGVAASPASCQNNRPFSAPWPNWGPCGEGHFIRAASGPKGPHPAQLVPLVCKGTGPVVSV